MTPIATTTSKAMTQIHGNVDALAVVAATTESWVEAVTLWPVVSFTYTRTR
jgi:hypothetical protein